MVSLAWTFYAKYIGYAILDFIGLLCIYAILRNVMLRNSPLFLINLMALFFNFINALGYFAHDLVSEALGYEIFEDPGGIIAIFQSLRWFGQLISLVFISFLHLLIVIRPMVYRKMQHREGLVCLFIIFLLSTALTVPLKMDCCGYIYHTSGFYWSYDKNKPGAEIFSTLNIIFQCICVCTMTVCDAALIWILYSIRRKRNTIKTIEVSTNQRYSSGSSPATKITGLNSTERRLAISFFLLSASFIFPTVVFNASSLWSSSPLFPAISFLSNMVEFSKWILYTLASSAARRALTDVIRGFCK